ncbi:NEL-type E3 ubiquitin ligase domain-containing protein [Pseudomonas sichuanensis]|uniref:NEL-type E3 ubiquitin ligase domain-containing protein n=1 Tax=Pseudomonas sichuanensis TaxID=2213015 RepID=UPI000DA6C8A2|nr:NEL-type E3 ubiquitin ligase domain-containing protein [Pseudomonas sichuanensis]
MPHSFPSPVSNDALLAQTLPAWLTRASTAHRRALCQSLLAQQRAQHALDQQLGVLLAIDAFAEPLLVEALQEASGLSLDVRACQLLRVWTEVQPVVPASLPLPISTHQQTQSLLAAALHNFSESEAQVGKILGDARVLAVPTDDEDRRSRSERLSAFLQAEPRRLQRLVRHTDSAVQNRDAWLQLLEPDDRLLRGMQWDSLMHEPGAVDFYQLLADLRGTEDFIFHRGDLAVRAWSVIENCAANTGLRERLFELAGHPRTCSDSVALNFSLLEVQSWVYLHSAGQTGLAAERSLQRLGRSLFRLDEVDRAASEEIARRAAQGIEYDEVEVRLMYRVGLAQALDLPGQPSNMRFPTSAEVSHRSLVAVRSQVLIAERTPRLVASVAQREFWQTHLRETYAQRFEHTDQPFHEQLERLQEADLPEGEYLSAIGAVAEAREAAMQTLIETLTQEIFARNPL